MSTSTLDRVTRKARNKARDIAEEDRRDVAAREARKRWEEIRNSLSSTAEQWADVAEGQWEQARDAAAPKVGQMKRRASEFIESDLEWLRDEVSDLATDLRGSAAKLSADVRTSSKAEADRIIKAVQRSVDEAREEDRRRRVRALVGWTAFGMAAGAFLALKFGPKEQDEVAERIVVADRPTEESAEESEESGARTRRP